MDNIKETSFVLGVLFIFSGCATFSGSGESEGIDAETLNVAFRIHFEDAILDFESKYRDGAYVKDFDAELYWGEEEGNPMGIGISLELDIVSIEGSRMEAKSRITRNSFTGWQNIEGGDGRSSRRIPGIRVNEISSNLRYDFQYGHWIDFVSEESLKLPRDHGEKPIELPRAQFMVSIESDTSLD